MYLHEDKEAFKELVTEAGEQLGIKSSIVEKDYYVTIALKMLSSKVGDIVFRGGTSLSKGYGIIDRFSEDIDISADAESGALTEGRKKKLKQAVVDTIKEIGLTVYNLDQTKSRRDYNQYIAGYHSVYSEDDTVKSEVIIETYVATMPFPNTNRKINNYIYQFLEKIKRIDLAKEFRLCPFEMKVQDVSRTCIDKVFALCDYFKSNMVDKHSRHIYDIYQLRSLITLDDDFVKLVREVREVRRGISICASAKEGINVNELLSEIIESECYKPDYVERTEKLLFKPVPYETAIEQLKVIINSNCFV